MKIKVISPLFDSMIETGFILTLNKDTFEFECESGKFNIPYFIAQYDKFEIIEHLKEFEHDLYNGFVSNDKSWYENYFLKIIV